MNRSAAIAPRRIPTPTPLVTAPSPEPLRRGGPHGEPAPGGLGTSRRELETPAHAGSGVQGFAWAWVGQATGRRETAQARRTEQLPACEWRRRCGSGMSWPYTWREGQVNGSPPGARRWSDTKSTISPRRHRTVIQRCRSQRRLRPGLLDEESRGPRARPQRVPGFGHEIWTAVVQHFGQHWGKLSILTASSCKERRYGIEPIAQLLDSPRLSPRQGRCAPVRFPRRGVGDRHR